MKAKDKGRCDLMVTKINDLKAERETLLQEIEDLKNRLTPREKRLLELERELGFWDGQYTVLSGL